VELGANTFPRASTSAASITSLKGELMLGRRKVSNENLMIEFAAMFTLNKNWNSLELTCREEMAFNAVIGEITLVTSCA
jgi:hypothetical protein